MPRSIEGKLNQLLAQLPEGLLVDAAWMTAHGYSTSLRSQYVSAGWLEQPTRGVFRRPRGQLRWEQVVISLQNQLAKLFIVGGRTALELQGFSHYLSTSLREVFLYGPEAPPAWLGRLPLDVKFLWRRDGRLFRHDIFGLTSLAWDVETSRAASTDPLRGSVRPLPWGSFDWPMTVSTAERAILEMIDELPTRESFHQVDTMMQGLTSLSPRRLEKLLHDCRSVKVKRLFFVYAFRHNHRWLSRLDPDAFDLGAGKRMLLPGGRLHPRFQITVPEDFDGEP